MGDCGSAFHWCGRTCCFHTSPPTNCGSAPRICAAYSSMNVWKNSRAAPRPKHTGVCYRTALRWNGWSRGGTRGGERGGAAPPSFSAERWPGSTSHGWSCRARALTDESAAAVASLLPWRFLEGCWEISDEQCERCGPCGPCARGGGRGQRRAIAGRPHREVVEEGQVGGGAATNTRDV